MSTTRHTASQTFQRRIARPATMTLVGLASMLLVACGSNVKLEDEPYNKPAPITSANVPGANSSGANNRNVPSTAVAPVVAERDTDQADEAGLVRVIYFDYDSNVVKEEFRGAIEGHAKRLNAAPSKRVTIEGHTDERGGREYNLALGQRRAEAVQKSLSLLGVSPEQMEAVSFGEERPAAQGSGEEAWAQNRRAEIKDR